VKHGWIAAVLLGACVQEEQSAVLPPIAPVVAPPRGSVVPRDPAPVTKGDVTVMQWRGMEILVKRRRGAEFVAARLYVKGGARNWGKDDAGVEQLALAVATSGGTERLAKDVFARRLAHLGSTVSSVATNEYSAIATKSLVAHWPETFFLMADTFLRPALPPAEIELQRQRQLAELKHEQEDPDRALSVLLHHALWKDHPLDNRSIGTLDSVAALARPKLASHLDKLRATSRLLLVVVGDVAPEVVQDMTMVAFASVPHGDYLDRPFEKVALNEPRLVTEERKIPTNYVMTAAFGPSWSAPDFPAAIVTMEILGKREWEEVRTKRNLSYAPGAYFSRATSLPRGGIYVSAVDPTPTFQVMLAEVRRLREEPVAPADLEGYRSVFITHYLTEGETTDGLAMLLAEAQLFGGSWELADTLPRALRAVTPEDVQRYAKKYFGHMVTAVVGDPAKLDRGMFTSM
jgi:predicted Zn-dependent peptidase